MRLVYLYTWSSTRQNAGPLFRRRGLFQEGGHFPCTTLLREFHQRSSTMLRQKGCFSVLIPFPGDSVTKRTSPVFPPRQARLSTGWNSPNSRADSTTSGRHQPFRPQSVLPSRDQHRRRSRCVSPPTTRCCNPSTFARVYPLPPSLPRACTIKRGVGRCPDTLGVEKLCLLRGFGRDVRTSPIDQEWPLPPMDAPAPVSH